MNHDVKNSKLKTDKSYNTTIARRLKQDHIVSVLDLYVLVEAKEHSLVMMPTMQYSRCYTIVFVLRDRPPFI